MADTSAPLADNHYLKELFTILRDNGRDTSGLASLLEYVSGMEQWLHHAESQLTHMRRDLAGMKEIQNHPVKNKLKQAITALEGTIAEVRKRLGELKSAIAEGAKNAVSAFKEKGVAALDRLASFFHVKGIMQRLRKSLTEGIRSNTQVMADIEAFSKSYHQAGLGMKNMTRVLRGKETEQEAKPVGKLAKTLQAPYRAMRSALAGIRKAVDAAIGKLEQLEQTATDRRAARATGKPTLMQRLERNKARVERERLEAPVPARTKRQEAAL